MFPDSSTLAARTGRRSLPNSQGSPCYCPRIPPSIRLRSACNGGLAASPPEPWVSIVRSLSNQAPSSVDSGLRSSLHILAEGTMNSVSVLGDGACHTGHRSKFFVNSFLPEGVISSRSLARVMPRRRGAMPGRLCRRVSCSGRPGFRGFDLAEAGEGEDSRLQDPRRKTGEHGRGFARGKRGFIFGLRRKVAPGFGMIHPLGIRDQATL